MTLLERYILKNTFNAFAACLVALTGVIWITQALRVAMVAAVVYGSLRTAANAWTLGDIGVGLMSWLNIIAILILQKPAMLALKDYEAQKASGRDPTFDPEALGIRNAELWSRRVP